jgi:hypothetical protein
VPHAALPAGALAARPVQLPGLSARGQGALGDKHAWADEASIAATQENTARLIHGFNAAHECREVTCLYNNANWFIEDLIRHPEKLDEMVPQEEREDWFL